MATNRILLLGFLIAASAAIVLASDQDALQDFCVADTRSGVLVNGATCKDPSKVQAEDFFTSGLHLIGNISNAVGSAVTAVNAARIPGLNTLGISLARLDYAPKGINPLHTHPRATELFTVIDGSVEVGFITTNPENRLIRKVLSKGDAFVFPAGLIHYERNVGYGNAFAISGLNSQNPGVVTIAKAVFGSNPDIYDEVLTKAFQLESNVVSSLKTKF